MVDHNPRRDSCLLTETRWLSWFRKIETCRRSTGATNTVALWRSSMLTGGVDWIPCSNGPDLSIPPGPREKSCSSLTLCGCVLWNAVVEVSANNPCTTFLTGSLAFAPLINECTIGGNRSERLIFCILNSNFGLCTPPHASPHRTQLPVLSQPAHLPRGRLPRTHPSRRGRRSRRFAG